MLQGLENKKRRNVRRIIFAVLLIAAITATVFLTREREVVPDVRYAVLARGDISRKFYVTAEIRAGAITEHNITVSQKVKEVKVSIHQQVNKGDILLVLDQDELKEKYDLARNARISLEKEIAQERKQAELETQNLRDQISRLSSELSAAIDQLSGLTTSQPTQIQIDPELGDRLGEIIAGFQPETTQEDVAQIIDLLTNSVTVTDDPEYVQAAEELESSLQEVNLALGGLLDLIATGGLDSSLLSNADLSSQLSGLSSLGITVQSPLEQAKAAEALAKSNYEASAPFLYAETPGLISAINVKEGEYAGPSASGGTQSALGDLSALEGLLGGMIPSSSSGSKAAVTIYDNTIPEAVFYAGRFDSGRLEEGMPVKFSYEDLIFTGKIIREGRIAVSSGAGQLEGLEVFGDVTGSSFSTEPQVEIVMSIEGEGLTDLVPGFWIESQIETAAKEDVVLLPAEAMRRELDRYYVFVLNEDDTVSRRYFEPGIQSELSVEVLSGLSEGDKVILSPPAVLEDGMLVKVDKVGADE